MRGDLERPCRSARTCLSLRLKVWGGAPVKVLGGASEKGWTEITWNLSFSLCSTLGSQRAVSCLAEVAFQPPGCLCSIFRHGSRLPHLPITALAPVWRPGDEGAAGEMRSAVPGARPRQAPPRCSALHLD